MSLTQKQHRLAVRLLKKLELDYIRLEREGGKRGRYYHYHAWSSAPPIDANGGSGHMSRQGRIRAPLS